MHTLGVISSAFQQEPGLRFWGVHYLMKSLLKDTGSHSRGMLTKNRLQCLAGRPWLCHQPALQSFRKLRSGNSWTSGLCEDEQENECRTAASTLSARFRGAQATLQLWKELER